MTNKVLVYVDHFNDAVVAESPALADFQPEPYADVLSKAAAEADVLLLPTSGRTRELAAMVAVDLETGVAPDVIEIEVDGGLVLATRPIYAGRFTLANCSPK